MRDGALPRRRVGEVPGVDLLKGATEGSELRGFSPTPFVPFGLGGQGGECGCRRAG